MSEWTRIRFTWSLAGRSYEQRKWLLITGDDITFSCRCVTATYTPDELGRLVARLSGERKIISFRDRLQAAAA